MNSGSPYFSLQPSQILYPKVDGCESMRIDFRLFLMLSTQTLHQGTDLEVASLSMILPSNDRQTEF